MRVFLQCAICLAALTPWFAPIAARAASDDEAAVRELVKKYVEARDKIDQPRPRRCSRRTPINSSPPGVEKRPRRVGARGHGEFPERGRKAHRHG